ncbi:MAG: 1-(5-phosphoribosyl)-5-[(5-phosphoribosylamino)methylideneamino]imidazole-4-carboxamide isomerase [Phycisphaerae bacterium]
MSIELYPAIDLRGGRVVRLLRGDYLQQTVYDVDPLDIAGKFRDAGCRRLHVVDLDGARDGKPVNLSIIENLISRSGMLVQVGGGIRTEEVMEYLLAVGADRVILGTRAIHDLEWFEKIVHDPRFRGRISLGLDARDGVAATHGWTSGDARSTTVAEIAAIVARWPLAAINYTDITRDGTLAGPNVQATADLAEMIPAIPIIHSGGVATLDDIRKLMHLSIAGIIVGRAVYEGTLKVAEAVQLLASAPSAGPH